MVSVIVSGNGRLTSHSWLKGRKQRFFFSDSLLFLDCLMLNGIMHVLLHSYEIKIVTK